MIRCNTDQIAREAARLYELGQASSIGDAIHTAIERLKMAGTPPPSFGRVREHLRGFAMQALGERGYAAGVQRVLEIAEEVMTLFEDCAPQLVGRGAKAQIDGGVVLHIRVYTGTPIEKLAEVLEEADYEPPKIETVNTRFGRLNRLRFEEDGQEVVLTRCLPSMTIAERAKDLFTGKKIALLELEELRARLSSDSRDGVE